MSLPEATLALSPVQPQKPLEEQLSSLLSGFTREEVRQAKAKAFWKARQARRRRKAPAPAEPGDVTLCPITLTSVHELDAAVIGSDGAVYERAALLQWLRRTQTSPLTRAPLSGFVDITAARRGLASFR